MCVSDSEKPNLMRSLGAFFGGIWHGVRTDPEKPEQVETRRDVEEEILETEDGGRMTLRRTTVEEIEVERGRGD